MKDDPTGQTVVFMLLWTSQYSTYVWPGMLRLHVHHSPSSCTEVFPWPLKYVLFFSFSLFRFDSTFSCAAEEIWGSESSPSGVHLCRLGVSQFKGKNETCNMNDCQNQARIGFHFLSTLYLWLVAHMIIEYACDVICVLYILLHCYLTETFYWFILESFTIVVNVFGNRLPAIATALLLMFAEKSPNALDPSLFYGEAQVTASDIRSFEVENCSEVWTRVFWQIICTTVIVALGILLGGGSLVCLSRASWAQTDQIQNGNSTDDILDNLEQEALPQIEPEATEGSLARGNLSSLMLDQYYHM